MSISRKLENSFTPKLSDAGRIAERPAGAGKLDQAPDSAPAADKQAMRASESPASRTPSLGHEIEHVHQRDTMKILGRSLFRPQECMYVNKWGGMSTAKPAEAEIRKNEL